MKASELREILRTVPDDVEVGFQLQRTLSKNELDRMTYKYPYDYEQLNYAGYDCGYSSRILTIFVEKESNDEN